MLISISTDSFLPADCAELFNFSASLTESTESTAPNSSTALADLLVCRWPIICHSTPAKSESAAAFSVNSCTRFLPKSRSPASYASRMRSGGCVFVTAISAIASGRRDARTAAAATCSRSRAMFSEIDMGTISHERHEVREAGRNSSCLFVSLVVTKLHDGCGRRGLIRTAGVGQRYANHHQHQHDQGCDCDPDGRGPMHEGDFFPRSN